MMQSLFNDTKMRMIAHPETAKCTRNTRLETLLQPIEGYITLNKVDDDFISARLASKTIVTERVFQTTHTEDDLIQWVEQCLGS